MLRQMVDIRQELWPRCIIPKDAKSPLVVNLVYCADGATKAAGAGVWARIEKNDGTFYCQLMLGKSELS